MYFQDQIQNSVLLQILTTAGIGELASESIGRINDYCESLPRYYDHAVFDNLLSFAGGLRNHTDGRAITPHQRQAILTKIREQYDAILAAQQDQQEVNAMLPVDTSTIVSGLPKGSNAAEYLSKLPDLGPQPSDLASQSPKELENPVPPQRTTPSPAKDNFRQDDAVDTLNYSGSGIGIAVV